MPDQHDRRPDESLTDYMERLTAGQLESVPEVWRAAIGEAVNRICVGPESMYAAPSTRHIGYIMAQMISSRMLALLEAFHDETSTERL